MGFAPNEGQAPSDIRFMAHQRGGTVLLLPSQAVFLPDPAPSKRTLERGPASSNTGVEPITVAYEGANPDAPLDGETMLPGKANYFLGSDQAAWRTGLPTFGAVVSLSLYPAINLRYDGSGSRLKSEYTVLPGGDLRRVRLRYSTSAGPRLPGLDKAGDLHVASRTPLTAQAPAAWQDVGPLRVPVSVGYVVLADGTAGFRAGAYDKTRPLHVSTSLSYSTYLGGAGTDNGSMVSVDSAGNAYVVGLTYSVNFPLANPYQGTNGGDSDVYVSKINPSGTALVYSTYLGGSGHDEAWGLGLDSLGSAYVAGFTGSTNFPVAYPFQGTNHGGLDAFVSKLSPSGSNLVYSTYIGGSGDDHAWSLAVSGQSAYIAGDTLSPDFPTYHPLQSSNRGQGDAFVARFSPSGAGLIFSTYLGGTGQDTALGIAVDGAGNAYVTGGASSNDMPIPAANVFQPYYRGGVDAIVAKFSPDGSQLLYCTYLGGSNFDLGSALAVRPSGQVLVTGNTQSPDFPLLHPVQPVKSVATDSFIAELSSSGSWLIYSTYLGGNGDYDAGYGAAVDSTGDSYVSGITDSTDFPTANAIQPQNGGQSDLYLSELSPGGRALLFSTYLGGSGGDVGWGMALDSQDNIYTTGTAGSTNFPTANPLQPQNGGGDDAVVVKVQAPAIPTPTLPACYMTFTDVPVGSTFYPYIYCLFCDGIINGYPDNTFRPNDNVTRGELTKIVSNAAGYSDPPSGQMFQDVPPGSTFAPFVWRLAVRGVVGGYPCGRPGEPCVPPANLPYFDPNANVTRGQSTKIVGSTAAMAAPAPGAQTFQDVPPSQPFYRWVEPMGTAGLVGGYLCGGPGEPCVPPLNRPYFRPGSSVTRGQASKIVANTFYPDCVQSLLGGVRR
jgi:hypothetical protein